MAVVHQPVHRCHGHGSTWKNRVPLAERLVGGHQQRAAFVAVADQLKQHRGFQLVAAHVADVVDHQQGVAIQLLDDGRQLVAGLGLLQQLHQSGGREEAAGLILLDHRHCDGYGQVGLAHAAGAKQQQILGLQQPGVAAGQYLQLLPMLGLDLLLIKAIESFLPGQMSLPQEALVPCQLTVIHLLLAEGIEELAGAPALGLSLLSERLPVAAEPRQLELFEQQRQGRFHRLRAGHRGGGGHRRPAGVGE